MSNPTKQGPFAHGCRNSAARVELFVDEFIRSEYVEALQSERDSDFINEPDRAARCADAAESGADGKTHAEVIEDWRDAFSAMMHDRARKRFTSPKTLYINVGEIPGTVHCGRQRSL